jgi:hypothetical protein
MVKARQCQVVNALIAMGVRHWHGVSVTFTPARQTCCPNPWGKGRVSHEAQDRLGASDTSMRGGLEIIQSDLEPHETPSLFPKDLGNILSSFDHLSPVYCCPLIGMLWTDHILCRNSSTYG